MHMISQASVDELKRKFSSLKRVAAVRQRFSLPPKAGEERGVGLEGGKALSEYGLSGAPGADTVLFKDLGPQVSRGQRGRARRYTVSHDA